MIIIVFRFCHTIADRIDAPERAIGPRALSCFDRGHPHVGRLFADPVAAASDYYRRTGIFPVMQVLWVRRSLADAQF